MSSEASGVKFHKFHKGRSKKILFSDFSFDFIILLVLLIVFVICLYPFWNIFIISVNQAKDTLRGNLYLWPRVPTLQSYKMVFEDPDIINATFVSIARTVIGTIVSLFFTSLLAYGMSKKDMFGCKAISMFFVFTMYFGGGLIPYYMVLKSMHLIDTFWVYIIPSAIGVYNMILIRIFIEALPPEIEESARLDGAGDFTVFFKFIIPLCKPVLATVTLFVAVGQWNSWFDTSLYTNSAHLETLQYVLVQILNNYNLGSNQNPTEMLNQIAKSTVVSSDSLRMATAMVATVPILIVYPFVQKYFVKGMMIGAVKS